MLLMVKRQHVLCMSNIEADEFGDKHRSGLEKRNIVCAASFRYNESTFAFIFIDVVEKLNRERVL